MEVLEKQPFRMMSQPKSLSGISMIETSKTDTAQHSIGLRLAYMAVSETWQIST